MSGDRDALLALALRVENASGADRALDVQIGAAARAMPIKGEYERLANWAGDFGPMPGITGSIAALHSDGRPGVHWEARAYTASLDAAMTLVPEGWCVAGIGQGDNGDWWCDLHLGRFTDYTAVARSGKLWPGKQAPTAALALTAACLKAQAARLSVQGGEG